MPCIKFIETKYGHLPEPLFRPFLREGGQQANYVRVCFDFSASVKPRLSRSLDRRDRCYWFLLLFNDNPADHDKDREAERARGQAHYKSCQIIDVHSASSSDGDGRVLVEPLRYPRAFGFKARDRGRFVFKDLENSQKLCDTHQFGHAISQF